MYFCWETGQFAVFSWLTLFGRYSSVTKTVLFYSISFIPFITTVWQLLNCVFFFSSLGLSGEGSTLRMCVHFSGILSTVGFWEKWKDQFWYIKSIDGSLIKMIVIYRVHFQLSNSFMYNRTNPLMNPSKRNIILMGTWYLLTAEIVMVT